MDFLQINNNVNSYYIPISQCPNNNDLVDNILLTMINKLYPVGTLYWTSDSGFDPNTELGGVWKRIEDKFIFAAKQDSIYKGGGNSSVTLAAENIPSHCHTMSHTHCVSLNTNTCGEHSHTLYDRRTCGSISGYETATTIDMNWYYTSSSWICTQYCYITSANGNHYHTASGNTGEASSLTTGSYGSGEPFDIMPPYETKYCWERVE